MSVLIGPDDGESLSIGGVDAAIRVPGSATDGAYALLEFRLEPGRLIPPHVHSREHELSFVLEGEIGARVGAEELTAGPGCVVVKPPEVPHAWWNRTTAPARVLEVVSPAGLEGYFCELAQIYASEDASERPPRLADLQARYGLTPRLDWIPLLKTRHGLRLLGEEAQALERAQTG